MKEKLFDLLQQENAVLVMPTQRSARALLADYARRFRTSVAMDRTLSFDTFSSAFNPDTGGARRADMLTRYIFASSFLSGEGKKLTRLYNPQYEDSAARFTSFIASILPSIGRDDVRITDHGIARDLALIRKSYRDFLDQNSFYEDSWLRKSADNFSLDRSKTYYLVSPEAEINMLRLLDEVGSAVFVRTVSADSAAVRKLEVYDNEKAEILTLFDRLEELRDSGVRMQDIIISTPDADRLRPVLTAEAYRRGIPLSFEKDAALAETKAGRYISQIASLWQSSYSFSDLERFLLDTSFPYTDSVMELNRKLIDLMCRHSVVSNSSRDLAFRLKNAEAAKHFRFIDSCIRTINTAEDSHHLNAALQSLTTYLFSASQFSDDEDDRDCYSFILDCLQSFCAVAGGLKTSFALFPLFVSVLGQLDYVSQNRPQGIEVMSYSHDYQIYAPYRFVIALNDQNSRHEASEYPFLQDYEVGSRRSYDVTDALIEAYCSSSDEVFFSCSLDTYDGRSIPPFYFTSRALALSRKREGKERRWADRELKSVSLRQAVMPVPDSESLTGGLRLVQSRPEHGFSYTRISSYAKCPFAARLSGFYGMDVKKPDPFRTDPRQIGTFLHGIAESFFTSHLGQVLEKGRSAEYARELEELFDRALEESDYTSYMKEHIRSAYREGVTGLAANILAELNDVESAGCEVDIHSSLLNGRADAVLKKDDRIIIIDFKKSPPQSNARYQLLIYKRIMDENAGMEVVDASDLYYYSFSLTTGRAHFFKECQNEKKLEQLEARLDEDLEKIGTGYAEGTWTPAADYDNCRDCSFRSVCRQRYFVK